MALTSPASEADISKAKSTSDSGHLPLHVRRPGPKPLRPAGDVPITMLSAMVVRGPNLATFTAQVLISPAGPTAGQTKDQLITLVRGVAF